MARLLIVYGTTEGQTRKIARRAAGFARELGHAADVADSAARPALGGAYDGVIVAGSIHAGRHQRSLARFVRGNLAALERVPTAFLSVSLGATGSDFPGARRCADAFLAHTGWRPGVVRLVAGALMYSRYGFIKRWMMRRIAAKAGGDTDTSRDYEYTDWPALRIEVEAFLRYVCTDGPGAGLASAATPERRLAVAP